MPNQIELFDIDNPCIGICQSNKRGYCFGCLRSRNERQLWVKMSNEQKREVLRLTLARKKRVANIRKRQRQQQYDKQQHQPPNPPNDKPRLGQSQQQTHSADDKSGDLLIADLFNQ